MRIICTDEKCGHLVGAHDAGACTEEGCLCVGLEICFLLLNEKYDDPSDPNFEFSYIYAGSAIAAVQVDCIKNVDLLQVYDDDEEVEVLWLWPADEDDVIEEPSDDWWRESSQAQRDEYAQRHSAWVQRMVEREDGEQFEFRVHVRRVAHTAIRPLPADPTVAIDWQVVQPAQAGPDEAGEGAEQNGGAA